MISTLPSTATTAFRNLLEQCQHAAFENAFSEPGAFVKKTIRGRIYWYFRGPDGEKANVDRYVGPETPGLLARIDEHRRLRADERSRRTLIAMLRSAGLPTPPPEIGKIMESMSRAGVFRHRVCVVGTHAFGLYSGLLGARFQNMSLMTADIDLAQFKEVSVAIAETETVSFYEALVAVDPTYSPVSKALHNGKPIAYMNNTGMKIELLTALRGPDTDGPVHLPSIESYSHGFRFLDFLIRDAVPSVALFGSGVLVNVPQPERFAIHKLIVADRRRVDSDKIRKDLDQAGQLIEAMWTYQKDDVLFVLAEAASRGEAWRTAILSSLSKVPLSANIANAMIFQVREATAVSAVVMESGDDDGPRI